VEQLKNPDLIFLPGSKNTMGDLKWMRENGLEAAIQKKAGQTPLFGICGGYQMLGEVLEDVNGVEEGGALRGMQLLPIRTSLQTEKQQKQVRGTWETLDGVLAPLSGMSFSGYEIHMGDSGFSSIQQPVVQITHPHLRQKYDGMCRGNIYGTYVHGIFDEGKIAQTLVQALARRKGISPEKFVQSDYMMWKESQYDLLADTLRKWLDMDAVYGMLKER
jgi:adenosylcobyric acid synthase